MNRMGLALVLVAGFLTVAGCSSGTPTAAQTRRGPAQEVLQTRGPAPLGPSAHTGGATSPPVTSGAVADAASYSLVPGPIYQVPSQYDASWADFQALVIGDVDGDRRDDIVARSQDNRVHVLRQRPDGTLSPAQTLSFGVWNYHTAGDDLLLADMDGDGVRDIVYTASQDVGGCCGPEDGMVGVARWVGDRWVDRLHVAATNGVNMGLGNRWVALDVDLDGSLDIAGIAAIMVPFDMRTGQYAWECGVDKSYCSRLRIGFGNGHGGFSRFETVILGLPYQLVSLAATDLNGDGRRDLAMTMLQNDSGVRRVMAQYQSGYGTLLPPETLYQDTGMGTDPYEQFGDVNGDGIGDVVAFNRVRTLSASGTYSQPTHLPYWGSWHAPATVVADLNGDRYLDVVNQQLKSIAGSWYRQPVFAVYLQKNGTLVPSTETWPTTHHYSNHPKALAVGDLNGDACGDVAVAASGDGVAVFYGSGCVPYVPTLPVEPGPEPAS